MTTETVTLGLGEIADAEALNQAMMALKTIDGVDKVDFDPTHNVVSVHYDTTKTSAHAFKAALTTVEYITEPLPLVAPANPNNARTLASDLSETGKL